MPNKDSMILSIDKLLRQIAADQEKRGEALSEPETKGGPSSHVSKNVDDNLVASTGSEPTSAEQSEDIKKQIGPASVDASPETRHNQQDLQPNTGVQQVVSGDKGVGESFKTTQHDPGTSHPAEAGKTAECAERVLELAKKAEQIGSDVLAAIAANAMEQVQKRAMESGYLAALAGAAGIQKTAAPAPAPSEDAAATSQEVLDALAETVQEAFAMAEKTAQFLAGYATTKEAVARAVQEQELQGQEPQNQKQGGMPGSDPAVEDKKEEAPPSEGDDAAAADVLGAAADGENPPPDSLNDIELLAQVLASLGVTPEELEAAAAKKAAEAVRQQQKPKWQPKTAEEAQRFRAMRDYIRELVGR